MVYICVYRYIYIYSVLRIKKKSRFGGEANCPDLFCRGAHEWYHRFPDLLCNGIGPIRFCVMLPICLRCVVQ